jgi:hypothetical protein
LQIRILPGALEPPEEVVLFFLEDRELPRVEKPIPATGLSADSGWFLNESGNKSRLF